MTLSNDYKIKLISVASISSSSSSASASQVIFDVTPTFSESREAIYDSIEPVHMPGGIQIYKRTTARKFTIGAHLISRTSAEATLNLMNLQMLRSWQLPYFGASYNAGAVTSSPQTASNPNNPAQPGKATAMSAHRVAEYAMSRISSSGIELLGAPPEVLYLYAYSASANDSRQDVQYGVNINRVPVVITSLDIAYPDDVDYLPTYSNRSTTVGSGLFDNTSEPFPIKMDINISLLEAHSPNEYERFSLSDYRQGKLTNF